MMDWYIPWFLRISKKSEKFFNVSLKFIESSVKVIEEFIFGNKFHFQTIEGKH